MFDWIERARREITAITANNSISAVTSVGHLKKIPNCGETRNAGNVPDEVLPKLPISASAEANDKGEVSSHWLIIQTPQRLEKWFNPPATRVELERHYPGALLVALPDEPIGPIPRDRLREVYSGNLDSGQRSYHWLILLPAEELEQHFPEAIARAELAKKYPPPAVLIPFVTAADMASLWPPRAK